MAFEPSNRPEVLPGDPPPIRRPLVTAALAWIGGVAAGMAWPPPPTLLALAVAAAVWSGVRLWRARRIHGPRVGSGRLLLAALAVVGAVHGGRATLLDRAAREAIEPWLGEWVRIEGRVAEEPRVRERSTEIVLRRPRLTSLRIGGGQWQAPADLMLYVGSGADAPWRTDGVPPPWPGQWLRVWARPEPMASRSHPTVFDPDRYWRGRGVLARVSVNDPAMLELGEPPRGGWAAVQRAMRTAREWIAANLARHLAPEDAALGRALLLGDAWLLDPNLRATFSDAGLAHLLAVSGLHTGFVLAVVLLLGRIVGLGPRAGALVGIVALAGYALLTGLKPPVVRASTMGAFVLGAVALGRVATTPAAIAAAAWATLLWDPRNLIRIDWQLSYVCVLSIALFAPPLYEAMVPVRHDTLAVDRREAPHSTLRRVLNAWVLLPLAVVLAVQMGLIPLQLHYFRRLYLLNPLANLVGVPLAFAAVIGLMGLAVLGWVPGVGTAAGWLATGCLRALTGTAAWFESLRAGLLALPPLPPWMLWVYYGALLSGPWLRTGRGEGMRLDRRQRASLLVRVAALAAVLLWAPQPRPSSGWLECTMLDVGQGDGLVIRFPNGRVMVVDSGPPGAGRRVVGPYLDRLGVRRIDYLVATHADADHIGGMAWLLEHYDVGLVIEGPDVSSSQVFADAEAAQRRRGVPTLVARWDQSLTGVEPARVRLLGPVPGMDDNNASVVLWITLGEADLLLTGDLEAPGERALLDARRVPDVEAIKVGHHGSLTSSSEPFLQEARPEIALVSVGRGNRYGHPAREVLARLEALGALVVRTDELGTVRLRTDGARLLVERYAGR